jgi:hypothetical protein
LVFSTRRITPSIVATVASLKSAQDVAEKILDSLGMRSKVDLQVVGNPAVAGISVPATVVPTGGMHNGKLYLFTDNIGNELEVFKVVFHELFHLGLNLFAMPE